MNTSFKNHSEALLDFIRNLQPGNIYFMASPKEVQRGFQLYSRQAISAIKWEGEKLVVKFLSHTVTLYVDEKGLHTYCDIHHNYSCGCVMCCLFTLKNLVNPTVFKINWDEEKHSMLLRQLNDTPTAYPLPVVHLRTGDFLSEEVKEDLLGKKSTPILVFQPEDRYEKIAIMVPNNYRYDVFKEKWRIRSNLYKSSLYKDQELLILLKSKGKEIPLSFDPDLKYQIFTGVYYNKHRSSMKKSAKGVDGSNLIAIDRFVIDQSSGRFNIVRDTTGWEVLLAIKSDSYWRNNEGIPDEIPLESNTTYYLVGQRDYLKELRFFSKHGETFYEQPSQDYLINAETTRSFGKEKNVEIRPLIETPIGSFNIYPPLYDVYTFIVNGRSGLIRRYEKRAAIIESFFDLILKGMDMEQFKSSFNEIMHDTPRWKRQDLKSFLSFLMDRLKRIMSPFKYRLIFKNGKFYCFPVDIKREVELLKTLPTTFDNLLFRYGFYDRLRVPESEFAKRLSDLFESANRSRITVSVDKKELRLSKWEIDLSIYKDKDIDWFELHPEIKINGVPVSEELWLQIVEGKNYVIGKDSIEVMDKETEDIVNHIRRLVSINKPGKKDIVKVPRLQILDWIELRKRGIKLTLPEEEERILNKLLGFEKITERPLPPSLNASLRPYQRSGYNWLCFLYEHRLGGCLADDMGLGKTLQAISLLTAIKDGIFADSLSSQCTHSLQPHLIVVPPSLIFNWESEIKKFSPNMKVCIYSGSERKADFAGYDIVITSYDLIRRDIEIFKGINFHVIIFDEAQAIKNIHAERTSAVRSLNGRFKIALTGTPIENHLGEYYSIIDLVLPGLLGDYKDFKGYIKSYNDDIINMLIKRTSPFVLRRRKDEILKELPPKIETEIFLELSPLQKGIYERTIKEVRAEIDEAYRTMRTEQARIVALTALLKLRQICLCPRLLSDELSGESPKIETLIEQLKEVLDEGHSALVFSQFTSFLDIVERHFLNTNIPFVRLDGSTPVAKRKEMVKEFQQSNSPMVFLLSLKAGGQGLNLTRASYVFHLDPWWNPAVEAQAIDRAHRIGQVKTVTVTRLLMKHTIEEKMKILKAKKQALYNAILDTKTSARGVHLTREDLDFLLG